MSSVKKFTDVEVKDVDDNDGESNPASGARLFTEYNRSAIRSSTPGSSSTSSSLNGNHPPAKPKTPLLSSNKVCDSYSSVWLNNNADTANSNETPTSTNALNQSTSGVGVTVDDTKFPTDRDISSEQEKKEAWKSTETSSVAMSAGKLGVCFVTGMIFGMAMQKGNGKYIGPTLYHYNL